jgi:drug/metabolite transporter (DMT)-like permease
MTSAFRHGEVGVLAPFNYTSIVWATLFGYVLWGESVGLLSLLGIILIVGSSVAVAIRCKEPEALNV